MCIAAQILMMRNLFVHDLNNREILNNYVV
jgi:hypothetical protein